MIANITVIGKLSKPFELQPGTDGGKPWGKASVVVFHGKQMTSFFEIRQTFFSEKSQAFYLGLPKDELIAVEGTMYQMSYRDEQTNKTVYERYVECRNLTKLIYVKKPEPAYDKPPSAQPRVDAQIAEVDEKDDSIPF